MAESELGTARLVLTAEPTQALRAIEAVKTALAGLDSTSFDIFKGLPQQATQSGTKAGAALKTALTQAVTAGGPIQLPQIQLPKLNSIRDALGLSGELKATLADLRAYKKALEAVRETASGTDPLFKRLTATIRETGVAIRAFESGTGDLVESLARVKNVAAGLTFERQLAALNAFRSGLQSVAKTALDASKAVAAVGAKGAVETLKVPVFGLPRNITSTIDQARAQIERLQKQSETASGRVARLSEGVAALGAGGLAAKGIIATLGGIAGSAQDTAGVIGKLQSALNALPGGLKGLGGLGDVFAAGSQQIQQWAAGILQAQGQLTTLAGPLQAVTEGLSSLGPEAAAVGGALAFTFAGFQDLIAKSFKPGVDGARAALKGMTADTQALLEALARVSDASKGIASLRDLQTAQRDAATRVAASPVGSEENVQATQELLQINKQIAEEKQRQFYQEQRLLRTEQERAEIAAQLLRATASPQLALPSSELLAQRVQLDGGRQPQRLSFTEPNLVNNAGFQAARDFTQGLLDSARAANTLEKEASQLAATLQVLRRGAELRRPALPPSQQFVFDPNAPEDPGVLRAEERNRRRREKIAGITDYANTGGRDSLAGIVPRTAAVIGVNKEAIAQERALREERRKTAQETARATRIEADKRHKRSSDAIGSGLIGGAFPLLFGQGVGASVGGGLGGVVGGLLGGQFGFGLSLVGTAVGAQIDTLTQRFIALGEALRDPIKNLDKFIEEATFASKSQEGLVKALAETGQTQAAADLIRSEASRTLDPIAAEGAAAAQDEFNRTLSDTRDVLGTIVAGPATGFLNFLSQTLRLISGNPQQGTTNPITTAIRSADNVGRRQGLNAGGQIAGMLLTLGGIGAVIGSGGLATPVAAGLIGTGLTMTALGTAGAESAKGDARVATSEAVITAELQVTKAKERQLLLESQILDARARGKKGLEDQLTLQAQFNALAVEQATGRSQIEQELQRNLGTFGGNDDEDRAKAARQNADLARAVEVRRRALVATASASQTTAARELGNAKQLVGVYGTQRGILEEQLKIRKAQRDANDAQQALNSALARGASKEEIDAAGKVVNAAILERQRIELQGQERIRQLEDQRWANAIASANRVRQIQEAGAIDRLSPVLGSTGRGVLETLAALRRAQDAEKEAQAQLRVEPGNEQLQNAAKEAAAQTAAAAETTRAKLLEAFQAAKDAVRAVSRSIQDATVSLLQLRGGGEGLNQFLSGRARLENQRQAFAALQPQFTAAREAAAADAARRGNFGARQQFLNLNFVGTFAQVNRRMIDFINAQRTEQRLGEDIDRLGIDKAKADLDLAVATKALEEANINVAASLASLTTEVQALVAKDWGVNVSVRPDGSADVTGDAFTRSLALP